MNSKTRNENDEEILLKNDNLASMLHQSAKPGEIIAFGTYPQMADGLDRMPIKWRGLKNSGTELFILSGYWTASGITVSRWILSGVIA